MRSVLAAISVLVVLVLLSPLATNADDFPISTQPMFATPQPRQVEFTTARAVDVAGDVAGLTMDQIAQTDDPLVAQEFVRDARRADRLVELCAEIAGRAGSDVAVIEIIELTHDLESDVVVSIETLESCEP